MNSILGIVVIAAVAICVYGAALPDPEPINGFDFDVDNTANAEVIDLPDLLRARRFSCDLFSFSSAWATPNSAVCAGKCIATGHKGGSCNGAICQCRGRWGK